MKSEANNVVKAFKFAKGDTIVIEYDPVTKKIKFSKEGTTETYTLDFEILDKDTLHPCVLFYYLNDEIEFLEK